MEGDDADAHLAQQARQTTPRRALQTLTGFAAASPDVGVLDAAALEEAHEQDPDATMELLAAMARASDVALREAARRLAARLLWHDTGRDRAPARGVSRMASVRHRAGEGDLDLDRSLEAVVDARAARRAVDVEELATRVWRRTESAWCLVLDRSGSMHGGALATAALTTAAFCLRAGPHRAALAFADDVVALASMDDGRGDEEVLDRVLDLRGGGTTQLASALDAAADQLGRAAQARRVTVLLSDCRATRPEDVAPALRRHDELVVLAPAEDPVAAYELARVAGARVETVAGPSEVPLALARLLG